MTMRLKTKNIFVMAIGVLALLLLNNSLQAQVMGNTTVRGPSVPSVSVGSSTISSFRQYSTGASSFSSGGYGGSGLFNYSTTPRAGARTGVKGSANKLSARMSNRMFGPQSSSILRASRTSNRRNPGLLRNHAFNPGNITSSTSRRVAKGVNSTGTGWNPRRYANSRSTGLDFNYYQSNSRVSLAGMSGLASSSKSLASSRGLSQTSNMRSGLRSVLGKSSLTGR